MKRLFLPLLLLAATGVQAQDKLYSDLFPLGQVTLLDSPFKHACDVNVSTLLQYDTDRLLAPFLKEAGLPPKARVSRTGQTLTDMSEGIISLP